MLRYIINRLIQGTIVMIVLFTITFFLLKALPNSPFQTEKAIPEHAKLRMEAYYGLDKPVAVQFVKRATNLLKGDPGVSFRLEGREVTEIISQAFPVSLQLGCVAMLIAIGVGIPLGVIAAWKKNTFLDYSAMAVAMIGICLPSFVIGPILADRFGQRWEVLPAMGWANLNPLFWILPSITLGLVSAAYLSRLTRAGMLDILNQDFVRTARAKGVSQKNILIRHCLRGGLGPAVAYIGPAFAGIISGSLVIESVFALPGLGTHFVKAIQSNDEPVLIGIVLLFGILIILANFATDLLGYWLNPRLRS